MWNNKLFIILIGLLLLGSCRTTQPVVLPVEQVTVVEYRDTTIYRDSIVTIPVETIKEVVPELDTLHMETSIAEATAYLDTTLHMLRGSMKNKKGTTFEQHEKVKIIYKDSIHYEEKPVPYPVVETKHPVYEKYLWLNFILFVFYIIYRVYRKRLIP